ncbi:MAG: CDP-diacylglycerol--glycerol-3-phosphate 3-phosphatidyltransferase [Legionellales bacterium]|nr:CDP-diacylglycerol--glycerol-3-phosphate 3-phosphatidyltransferase [Legionellales bacterium]
MNLPTYITGLRVLLIPILVIVYGLPMPGSHWAAALIFVLGGVTDWVDGYLARSLGQTSRFGAFLDPVADKLMVVIALVLVIGFNQLHSLVFAVIIIVGREIIVSALREWMAELGKRHFVAVNALGKWKTTSQMVAVTLLILYQPGQTLLLIIGGVSLYIAAVLTVWSMWLYLRDAWVEINS